MSILISTSEILKERLMPIVKRIIERPQENYSIQELSIDAGISKYHFHRIFALFYGKNIYEFVLLNRLKLASDRLLSTKDTITRIAFDCGYSSAQSFAKAFRNYFSQTPSEFIKSPNFPIYKNLCLILKKVEVLSVKSNLQTEINIGEFPQTQIIAFRHRGNPNGVNKNIETFAKWRISQGLSPLKFATFTVFHSPLENETYDVEIGCEFDENTKINDEFYKTEINAHKCAILKYIGEAQSLEVPAGHLYRTTIEMGHTPADYPLFCKRISFPPFVASHEAETILYLPIL